MITYKVKQIIKVDIEIDWELFYYRNALNLLKIYLMINPMTIYKVI